MNVRGKAFVFGDRIDTDVLAPGPYMRESLAVLASHCLEAVDPDFAGQVRPGDIVVGGESFGIGSSREQAAAVLVHLGVAAVIAPSFGGLFFRNAFNLGLLLLTCPAIDALRGQSDLVIDADPLRLRRRDTQVVACEPVPDFLLAMAQAGGLLPQLRQRLAAHASSHLNPPRSHHDKP